MKQYIKKYLLEKFHAIERQDYDITETIVTTGLDNYLNFNFDVFKSEILDYIKSVNTEGFKYKYAASAPGECLYASIYAVLIEGILDILANRTEAERRLWADYLNSFQNPDDGLYYDPNLSGSAYEHIGIWNEGWGKHHLMGHIIIALARLGYTPKYRFKYLEKYYDVAYLKKWMESFDFSGDVWTASNYFMNLYTVLEYARDYMNEGQASSSISLMEEWLRLKQNPVTGMWHDVDFNTLDHLGKLKVVRAAYHFYPLFEYERIDIPFKKKIIDTILPLQNRWGGWTIEKGNSGACEDIDAIEPLIRCALSNNYREKEIESAIKKSMIWQMGCRNADKGFSFYMRARQEYGGHSFTTSQRDESSMFATWFRILCIAYEMQFLNIKNKFNLGRFPGYEISLY